MTEEEIRVGFRVDLGDLNRGVDQATRKIKTMEARVKKTSNKFVTGFKDMATAANGVKLAVAGAAAVVGSKLVSMSIEIAKFSQSADDVHDYFRSSFGLMSKDAGQFASNLSKEYQIYEETIMQFMGRLNQAYISAGANQSKALSMTKDMTKLSYDLTRYFSDLSLEEIQKAMLDMAGGEAMGALKTLGIAMTEVDFKNKALSMGLAKQGMEMTAAQKQATAYAIVMDELSAAQGAYGQAVWNMDNVTQDWNRSTNELKESIGTVLRPVVAGTAKVIIAAMDQITAKVNRFIADVKGGIYMIKEGINWLSAKLGRGDVFHLEEVEAPTKALDSMLQHLGQSADKTKQAMSGLLGFDKLNVLSPLSVNEIKTPVQAEAAMREWIEMFKINPEEASKALDRLWGEIVQGNFSTVDELKEQYGEYFDWILEAEGINEELTEEQKLAMMDKFYGDMFKAYQEHRVHLDEINKEYTDLENAYKILQEGITLEKLASMNLLNDDALAKYGMSMTDLENIYREEGEDALLSVLLEKNLLNDDVLLQYGCDSTDLEAAHRLMVEGKTLNDIKMMRQEEIDAYMDYASSMYSVLWVDLLSEFKFVTEEMARIMREAFVNRMKEVRDQFREMIEGMVSDVENLIDKLNTAIRKQEQLNIEQSKPKPKPPKEESLWDKVKGGLEIAGDILVENAKQVPGMGLTFNTLDKPGGYVDDMKAKGDGSFAKGFIEHQKEQGDGSFWKGLLKFADGGVFEPNRPMPVIVGDNTREREVIAPESMIEQAVIRAMGSMGGMGTSAVTIPVTVEIDGREIARATYKYNRQEALRRGETV